jgi:hypothetical protein
MTTQVRKLLFLKSTGVLIGEITKDTDVSVMDLSQFYVKDVTFNIANEEYWYGDYATGEVRSRNDKAVVIESVVKYSTNTKIISKYPIHNQIDIIIDMLAKSNLEKTPEFLELKTYLDVEIQKHKDKIQAFASNSEAYVFLSAKEEQQENAKKII